jgi:hypothetical protein
MELEEGDELKRQRRAMNSCRKVEEKPLDLPYGCIGVRCNEGRENRSDTLHLSDTLHRSNYYGV